MDGLVVALVHDEQMMEDLQPAVAKGANALWGVLPLARWAS